MSAPAGRLMGEYRSAEHEGAPADAAGRLLATAEAVLARRLASEPSIAMGAGQPVRHLATLDPARLHADAACFVQARDTLDTLPAAELSIEQDSFRRALVVDLSHRAEAARYRGLDFVVAPYSSGDLHAEARQALAAHPLASAPDREAYVELLRDYARLTREMLAHTSRQQASGVYPAAPAVPAARAALKGVIDTMSTAVLPADDRLASTTPTAREALRATVSAILQRELLPPLQRLCELLEGDGAMRGPDELGLHRYPGGEACYRHLIRRHAETDLEPEAIHQTGLQALDRLHEIKSDLRARLLPGIEARDFERALRADTRWRAATPADIEACFVAHVRRVEALLPRWFGRWPATPWAVTRADPAFEHGMTFGYFQRATPADPVGRYRYNGSDPGGRSLIGAGHLICHELLPGHHLQLSIQDRAPLVHPLQRLLFSTATVEGWAVYASELACEMGALTGFDLYGHAQMQGLMAARLVVDTGLNALGWTLDQARAFMHTQTVESEGVIESELLRYGADIPAQALAYEMGRIGIARIRQHAQDGLGAAFDVRQFHDALLVNGGYPLPVLAAQIDRWMAGIGGSSA